MSDICDAGASCHITTVTSNEAIDGPGDGSSEPDYVITGALTLELRAERSGILVGRTYTVSVECGDGSGNTTTRSVDVTV